jgi:hypothetical protein
LTPIAKHNDHTHSNTPITLTLIHSRTGNGAGSLAPVEGTAGWKTVGLGFEIEARRDLVSGGMYCVVNDFLLLFTLPFDRAARV